MKAFLLLALALIGCGYQPPAAPVQAPEGCAGLAVVIDPAFTPAARASIEAAAAEWSAVGVPVDIVDTWSAAAGRRLVVVKEATPFEEPAAATLGRTAIRPGLTTIRIVTFRLDPGPKFVGVVKHELGHALGLEHAAEGLMRAHAAGNPAIGAKQVAKACNQ